MKVSQNETGSQVSDKGPMVLWYIYTSLHLHYSSNKMFKPNILNVGKSFLTAPQILFLYTKMFASKICSPKREFSFLFLVCSCLICSKNNNNLLLDLCVLLILL